MLKIGRKFWNSEEVEKATPPDLSLLGFGAAGNSTIDQIFLTIHGAVKPDCL